MKTGTIMQQAMINAGLLTEDRIEKINRIEKEERRKKLHQKRMEQAKRAKEMKARFHGRT